MRDELDRNRGTAAKCSDLEETVIVLRMEPRELTNVTNPIGLDMILQHLGISRTKKNGQFGQFGQACST